MNMRPSRQEVDDKIYEMLLPRLNQVGLICTNDAYRICRGYKGLETVARAFRNIMATMIAQGKAKRISQKEWQILKPNTKFTGSDLFKKYEV